MQYSNPRLVASFPDWPSGAHRVACIFKIEHTPKRGYRVHRTTQNKRGEWCKPKVTTYGGRAVIVDGDDGRTYIVQSAGTYGFIRVMRSDFMDHETVWPDRSPEHHAALLALIEQGNTLIVCPSCGASRWPTTRRATTWR